MRAVRFDVDEAESPVFEAQRRAWVVARDSRGRRRGEQAMQAATQVDTVRGQGGMGTAGVGAGDANRTDAHTHTPDFRHSGRRFAGIPCYATAPSRDGEHVTDSAATAREAGAPGAQAANRGHSLREASGPSGNSRPNPGRERNGNIHPPSGRAQGNASRVFDEAADVTNPADDRGGATLAQLLDLRRSPHCRDERGPGWRLYQERRTEWSSGDGSPKTGVPLLRAVRRDGPEERTQRRARIEESWKIDGR